MKRERNKGYGDTTLSKPYRVWRRVSRVVGGLTALNTMPPRHLAKGSGSTQADSGQLDGQGGTFARLAFNADRPLVLFDDLLDHRQAQANPKVLG